MDTRVNKEDGLPWPVRAMAEAHPERIALVAPERTMTYRQLDAWVEGTARRLEERIPEAKMSVALSLPNGWPFLVFLLAMMRADRVACLLHRRAPEARLPALMQTAGASTLITDLAWGTVTKGVTVLAPERLLATSNQTPDARSIAADQPATVVFTSGSSGEPKAALHTYGNHHYNALGSNENIALAPGDRWLLALPLYHVGGLGIVFRCLLAGATIVLADPGASLASLVARYQITHLSVVPTQLQRLLDASPSLLASLKAILVGGSALPAHLLDAALERKLPLHTTYGLTEMASQVTTTPPNASHAPLRSSGRLLPYRELALADDGEILVRGKTLFAGYLDGSVIRQATDDDGWFHTRDLGFLDAAGRLHVSGRKDRQFISGGENIQPEEIERALCQLEGVRQTVVVAVPDATYGQRPVAFVRADGGIHEAAWREALADFLPRFKIPDAFLPWPETDERSGLKVPFSVFVAQAEKWKKEQAND